MLLYRMMRRAIALARTSLHVRGKIVNVEVIGALCFGLVIGWVTYRTLRRQGEIVALSNIATVIGAVGGAAVTALYTKELFGWYSIGLTVGFFLYLILGHTWFKDSPWLGGGN
jgi:uncharacterized membrane protein YeaQ/YmgE (transglycosylase-associated protein family)